ncbi:MAG: type II CAAX endopeptidase family protein [Cyanobacteria bacterium J06626_18]
MQTYWRFLQRSSAPVRILGFLLGVLLIAAPLVVPLYRFEYAATDGKSVIGAPVCLFVVFAVSLPFWGRRVHGLKKPWRVLGFQGGLTWWRFWGVTFAAGATGVAALYTLQLIGGWAVWVPPAGDKWVRTLLEGFLVGFGVGIAEELIFRGWLLFELEQDYSSRIALWINALLFAIAHYTRPLSVILETWPQFFGLLLLGLTLVWARRIPVKSEQSATPRTLLGAAVGLHGGLVWAYYQVDVNDLIVATGKVPDWLTGVGGNPLAGVLGLGLLGAIAGVVYRASH